VIVTFTADSVARYRINEQLARVSLPTEAVGETQDVAGAIVFSADGVVVRDASTVRIGLASLRSDEGRRDGYVRNNTLRTGEFPDAFVTVNEVRGLPWPLPSSGEFLHTAGHGHYDPRCDSFLGVGGYGYV
jgi:polyisoprenoid-binding protein YceI